MSPHLARKKSGNARGGGATGEGIREAANRREVHGVRCIEAGETNGHTFLVPPKERETLTETIRFSAGA